MEDNGEMFGMFRRGAPQYLIVGLGNPGPKYEMTRHNAGFKAIDAIAENAGVSVRQIKFHALVGEAEIGGQKCLLMKPQTLMNASGIAVQAAAAYYKIPVDRIIVLFDDISLKPGAMRIRRKGSDGGHNGIKSLIAQLDSEQFPRVKIGVGAKPNPDYDLAAWVLSKFTPEEQKLLNEAYERAPGGVELMVSGRMDEAMNRYNS